MIRTETVPERVAGRGQAAAGSRQADPRREQAPRQAAGTAGLVRVRGRSGVRDGHRQSAGTPARRHAEVIGLFAGGGEILR